ncbi:hypothetical protein H1D32_17775 [Anaerobacillus sp. CMMVII]|uniref:hypothetical protein n=1 Tax=Anaerobacillus sp. CMMVII TaxID=2755588 RepID=UPI0021B7B893|nr:hypothetical protein [Anaerobacillus sp. CMMVII]MCT8139391.1 hypothetical protein [Anaerobacillus sp. CMMVII]
MQDLLEHIPIEVIKIEAAAEQNNTAASQEKIYTAKRRYDRKVGAYTAGLISIEDLQVEKDRLDTLEEALIVKELKKTDYESIEAELKQIIGSILEAFETLPPETVKVFSFLRKLLL